jgi:hypothetical protein
MAPVLLVDFQEDRNQVEVSVDFQELLVQECQSQVAFQVELVLGWAHNPIYQIQGVDFLGLVA